MNNNKRLTIYTITGIQRLNHTSTLLPDFGSTRVFGFFNEFIKAEKAVRENMCNINESGLYAYAIVEQVNEGIHESTGIKWFYKFNTKTEKYEPIKEPDWCKYFIGHSMG